MCRDGHQKPWFRATVANDGPDAEAAVCQVRAYSADDHVVFTGHLPVELITYPHGPPIRPGTSIRLVGFFVEAPNRPVDHYAAGCEARPDIGA
jgi:hypothetical protein